MGMTINKIKWFAVSTSALSLLMVFWAFPAWNSGSQQWYLGNDSITEGLGTVPVNIMYRNQPPPPGHNNDFVFSNSLYQSFKANEAARTFLDFGHNGWQYYLEWYYDRTEMVDLDWTLNIGRWRNSMFEVIFSEMGSSHGPGSQANPVIISGTTMSSCPPLTFEPGDVLGAMFTAMTMTMGLGQFHVVLDNTCYITSPLSDPGYPGAATQVPTLSQWGMLLFAIIIAGLSMFVLRRRVRMSRH